MGIIAASDKRQPEFKKSYQKNKRSKYHITVAGTLN